MRMNNSSKKGTYCRDKLCLTTGGGSNQLYIFTHTHAFHLSRVSSLAPTWFLISPSSTIAIDPGCQATPKIPKDRRAQACARIDQRSCSITHIYRDVQKESGCHGDFCRLAAKASLNVCFSRGWQKGQTRLRASSSCSFIGKKIKRRACTTWNEHKQNWRWAVETNPWRPKPSFALSRENRHAHGQSPEKN